MDHPDNNSPTNSSSISTTSALAEDRELLAKAAELVDLFQTAIKLGYSITFSPEQMKLLVAICEEGYLHKPEAKK